MQIDFAPMKSVLLAVVLLTMVACASKPNESSSMQDPSQMKAEAKARDDFAKSLPKPPDR
jgi:type IV pilus biogenesis protein CpaD/CtpE